MMKRDPKPWFMPFLVLLFAVSLMGGLPAHAAQDGPPDLVILYTSDGRGQIKCYG